MKKIIVLLICLLVCGCENSIITDEAKYKDNAFKNNNEIETVSDSIANDINKLLEDNNLKATIKFVKKGSRPRSIHSTVAKKHF